MSDMTDNRNLSLTESTVNGNIGFELELLGEEMHQHLCGCIE